MDNSNTRQQKVEKQIQKDMAEILQREMPEVTSGALVTVTAVRVSPDFAYAKVYVSIFPFNRHERGHAIARTTCPPAARACLATDSATN